jgi:hypothetical protein
MCVCVAGVVKRRREVRGSGKRWVLNQRRVRGGVEEGGLTLGTFNLVIGSHSEIQLHSWFIKSKRFYLGLPPRGMESGQGHLHPQTRKKDLRPSKVLPGHLAPQLPR